MAGMERFTQRARRVLSFAHQEAEKLGSLGIGPEHILLGLIGEEGGVAGRAFRESGVRIDRARVIVDELTPGAEKGKKIESSIPLAPLTEELLESAVDQAREKSHHYIGTEHILLALIAQKQTRATKAIEKLGLQLDSLREKIDELLRESATPLAPSLPLSSATSLYSYVRQSLERLSKADQSDVQSIAASQIQLLTAYYSLVLDQARRSFTWALIAAALGLLFFIASVTFIIFQESQSAAIISLVSGALIEFISAINFYLYAKTSSQLTGFQARLDTTQRYLLANSMCEGLSGEHQQKTRADLIRAVAGVIPEDVKTV